MKRAIVFLCLVLFLACSPAGRKPETPAYWQAQKARWINYEVEQRQKCVAQRWECLSRRIAMMDSMLARAEKRLDSLRVKKITGERETKKKMEVYHE